MESIKGNYLKKLPLQPLRVIADLVYYDGPLLTLLSSQSGEDNYFYYWCDIDDRYNRWLVFRVTETQIKSYLHGQKSLREVIRHPIDNYYFVGDLDKQLNWQQVWLVIPSDLPSAYLPKEDSWFDKELDGINEEDWKILEQRFLTAPSYRDEGVSQVKPVNCNTIDDAWLPKRGQHPTDVSPMALTDGISGKILKRVTMTIHPSQGRHSKPPVAVVKKQSKLTKDFSNNNLIAEPSAANDEEYDNTQTKRHVG